MHIIEQLQVMYQRLEDHCNILRVAMQVTTGLILEQSCQPVLVNQSVVPSLQNDRIILSQVFQLPGATGFHPQLLHIHSFCCSPRLLQRQRGVSLCSICGQLETKETFRVTGNSIKATLCWASCCYCTSWKFEGGPQCTSFL